MGTGRFRFRMALLLSAVFAALMAPLAATAQNYLGYLDRADCYSMSGWVWDGNINDTVSVDILDGASLIGTYPANQFRSDVAAAGFGNGWYGWSLATPLSLNDGQPHTIHVRPHGTATDLTSSPKTFSCAYLGYFDGASLATLTGWAWQVGVDTPAVSIDIFDSATRILTGVPANRFRADLPGAGSATDIMHLRWPHQRRSTTGRITLSTHVSRVRASIWTRARGW